MPLKPNPKVREPPKRRQRGPWGLTRPGWGICFLKCEPPHEQTQGISLMRKTVAGRL